MYQFSKARLRSRAGLGDCLGSLFCVSLGVVLAVVILLGGTEVVGLRVLLLCVVLFGRILFLYCARLRCRRALGLGFGAV